MTLAVDAAGRATSFPGGMKERDVTVQMRQDPLLRAFARGSAGPPPPSEAPRVTYHSQKGNVAYDLLKGRLGL